MNQIPRLIKQQLKREFIVYRGKFRNKKSLFSIISIGFAYILVVFASAVIYRFLVTAFSRINMEKELMVLTITFIQIVQFLVGINRVNTFNSVDDSLKVLAVTPIKEDVLFFSKIALLGCYQLLVNWAMFIPALTVFGINMNYGADFAIRCVIAVLLCPMLPFFLTIIFSFPLQFFMKLFERIVVIRLLLVTSLMLLGLISYINMLSSFKDILITGQITLMIKQSTILTIIRLARNLVFGHMLSNICFGIEVGRGVLLNCVILVPTGIIAFVCARYLFPKMQLLSFKRKKVLRISKKKKQLQNPFYSLLKKEFLVALRNPNYGFFFFGLMIAVPVLVYFTMLFLKDVAIALYNESLVPTVAIFVMVSYSLLTNLYACSTISREGTSIQISKTIPVSYKTQVLAKTVFAATSPLAAVYIAAMALIYGNILSWYIGLLLMLASTIMVIGRVCDAILRDLRKPLLDINDAKSFNSINWSLISSVLISLIFSIVIGGICFVVSYFSNAILAYLTYLGLAIITSFPFVWSLFKDSTKYYSRISRR